MKTLLYFVILLFIYKTDLFYAKISPLNNETYLLTSGSHGLRVTQYGQSFIYSGVWDHIFFIKFPSILNKKFKYTNLGLNCAFNSTEKTSETICNRYNYLMNLTSNATESFSILYQNKFENLLKQQTINSWISKKRALIPVIGDVLGLLFGTSTQGDVNNIKDKFEILSQKIVDNNKQTALNKEALMGLTYVMLKRSYHVNNAFNEISEHLKVIEDQLGEFNRKNYIFNQWHNNYRFFTAKLNDMMINTFIEMYNLMLFGSSVEDLEEALIQMRRGLLPSSMISPDILKTILYKVEKSVSPLYTIGIQTQNIDFYYLIPLIRFSIVSDGLFIRLSIPLQTINTQTVFNILKPMSNPIPCSENICQWSGRLNDTETFLTLILRENCWLTDINNINLMGEVDFSTLSCITITGNNLCYSFDRSLIQTQSICSSSLWNWDSNLVRKHCNFEISLRDNYQPIRMSENIWILHRDVIKSYDIICESRMGSKTGARTRALLEWAEEVIVEPNCYLKTDKFILYGPLKERDNRLDRVPTKSPIFIFDKEFEKVTEDINSYDNKEFFERPKRLKKFDSNKMNEFLTLDQKAITKVVDNIYNYAYKFDTEMNEYSVDRQNTKNFMNWQTTLNAITKVFLFFSFSILVIILIRLGYGLYGIFPIIINEIDGIDCYQMINRESVQFLDFFPNDPYNSVINLTLFILAIALFYGLYRHRIFRILRHTIHYCNIEHSFSTNFIVISFKYLKFWTIKPFIREVVVQYSMTCLSDEEEHADINIIGNSRIWQIYRKNEKTIFRLLAPVNIAVFSNGDFRIKKQRVEFEIKDLQWFENRELREMREWNSYGDSVITHYREGNVCRTDF